MSTPRTPNSIALTMKSSIVIFPFPKYELYEYAQQPGSSLAPGPAFGSLDLPSALSFQATDAAEASVAALRKSRLCCGFSIWARNSRHMRRKARDFAQRFHRPED